MIDGMFQSGTDQALDDQMQRPQPFKADEPKLTLGQLAKAPFQGISSGSTKSAAFAADMVGAFGEVEASTGVFGGGGMFATQSPEERKQSEEARNKMALRGGPDFSSPAGDMLRQRAKEVMPDPTQTHAATQVIAGVAEFATQAVGYSALAGPAAPALLAGDVGLAEADKLKQQGVDLATRTKAGAVAGVAAGASIAIPVAVPGSIAKTAVAVAVGGPGSFMVQNATERAILEHANYKEIANQYDPFDPVGLALSTIVPAGFGAVAVRGARAAPKAPPTLKEVVLGIESNGQRYAEDGSVLTSPKGAKGEMQVMDDTNLDPGFGVRPAADNSLAERARVGSDYLDAMLKRYGGDEAKAMAAYNAGPGALDKALAKGGDWRSHLPAETQAYVAKGMKKLGSERTGAVARAAIARDPEAVAAARVNQTASTIDSYRLTPDSDIAGMARHTDAMESAHAQLARGEPVAVSDLVRSEPVPSFEPQPVAIVKRSGENMVDVEATVKALPEVPPDHVRLYRAEAPDVKFADVFDASQLPAATRASHLPGQRYTPDLKYADYYRQSYGPTAAVHYIDVPTAVAERGKVDASEYKIDTQAARAEQRVAATASAVREVHAAIPEGLRPVARATGADLFAAAGESAGPTKPKAAEAGSTSMLDKHAAEVAELNPDLMVQLEGMDGPMRVGDLLEQVKKEAAEEKRDASLVEVAANCFLRT